MRGLFILLLLFASTLHAQTFTVTPTTATRTATPVVTWDFSGYTSCVASGGWTGAKAITGTQTMPAITATTAPVTVSYTLTCAPPNGLGTATVSWVAPTKNTDGSTLTNLKGYRIFRADTANAVGAAGGVDINNAGATSYIWQNLSPGTHYFGLITLTTSGEISALSNVVSKTIVGSVGQASIRTVSVTVNPPTIPLPPTGVSVIETTAYDVQRKYFGWFGPYVANNRVGTVEIGTACTNERVEGKYNGVSRLAVTFTRTPRSSLIVARCG